MSVLDDFVRYGTVTVSRESGVTKVVFTATVLPYNGQKLAPGVPDRLVVMENDADDALFTLWNTLVDHLHAGERDSQGVTNG